MEIIKSNEQLNLFGGCQEEEIKKSLFDKFIIPPFSVLDRRQNYWQNRKRAWLALGIKSEVGRDKHLTYNLNSMSADKDKEVRMGLEEEDAPSTSVFDPVLCEIAYKWFCPKYGKIIDPFCGGSVRGVVAGFLGYSYVGIDLRKEQIEANEAQAEQILGDSKEHSLEYIQGDSDKVLDNVEGNLFDFAFTCPPYFDLEKYSDDERDLSNMDWEDFKEAYSSIIGKTVSKLKSNSFFGIVVGNVRGKDGTFIGFPKLTQEAMEKTGLRLYDDLIVVNACGSASMRADKQFNASRKCVTTHQRFMVFVKGDPKKATNRIKGE